MPVQFLIDYLGAKKYLEWLNSFELSNQKKKTPWNSLKITIERQKGKTPDPPNKTIPSHWHNHGAAASWTWGTSTAWRPRQKPPKRSPKRRASGKPSETDLKNCMDSYMELHWLGNHFLHVECLSLSPFWFQISKRIIARGSCRVLDTPSKISAPKFGLNSTKSFLWGSKTFEAILQNSNKKERKT